MYHELRKRGTRAGAFGRLRNSSTAARGTFRHTIVIAVPQPEIIGTIALRRRLTNPSARDEWNTAGLSKGLGMKNFVFIRMRPMALAAALFLGLLLTANVAATSAQAQDAESLCTGDVMRLCSEFVPDRGQIT